MYIYLRTDIAEEHNQKVGSSFDHMHHSSAISIITIIAVALKKKKVRSHPLLTPTLNSP